MASKRKITKAPSVKDIRKRYGKPVTSYENNNLLDVKRHEDVTSYCIGGAFMLYVDGIVPFPGDKELAEQLQNNNPALSEDDAAFFAYQIIRLNDARDFSKSWKFLAAALGQGNAPLTEFRLRVDGSSTRAIKLPAAEAIRVLTSLKWFSPPWR